MGRLDMRQQRKFFYQIFAFIFVFIAFQLIGNVSALLKNVDSGAEILEADGKESASIPEVKPEGIKYLIYSEYEGMEAEMVLEDLFASTGVSYGVYRRPEEFDRPVPESIEAVLICSNESSILANRWRLQSLANRGISLVFLQMPTREKITEYELYSVLGIHKEITPVEHTGMRMVSGFMMGGLKEYKELTFPMQSVSLQSTCKTFAYGLEDKKQAKERKNEELPPVIWRNSYMGSKVFVVNGPFINQETGKGIVSSILAQMSEAYLYPVINGMTVVAENFPFIKNENQEELLERYNYTALTLQQDIILPSLISTSKKYDIRLGCFIKGEEADLVNNETYRNLNYFIREIKILGGEIGFHTEENQIPYTVQGIEFSDEKRLAFYSAVTYQGLISHSLDMEEVLYPNSEKDDWIFISRYLDTLIYTFRSEFPQLLVRNPSELAKQVRNYKNGQHIINYGEKEIRVQRKAEQPQSYFILRTNNKLTKIVGGTAKQMEEDVYMVTMNSEKMQITLSEE